MSKFLKIFQERTLYNITNAFTLINKKMGKNNIWQIIIESFSHGICFSIETSELDLIKIDKDISFRNQIKKATSMKLVGSVKYT